MVGNVACVELELAVGVGLGGQFGVDLAVLDDLAAAIAECKHTDGLGWAGLLDHL